MYRPQPGLVATTSLGFLAFDKMSELEDGSIRAKETQPRPDRCYKVYGSFKYNTLKAFHHTKSLLT
jgi:hypothetical protein